MTVTNSFMGVPFYINRYSNSVTCAMHVPGNVIANNPYDPINKLTATGYVHEPNLL